MPQRNAPTRKAQVGRVVIDSLQAHGFRRPDGDAVNDPAEVREMERGAGPEFHLTFDQCGLDMRYAVQPVAMSALERKVFEAIVRVETADRGHLVPPTVGP